MFCEFEKQTTKPNGLHVWICPKCETEKVASHAPKNRQCGPSLVKKAVNFSRSMFTAAGDSFKVLSKDEIAARQNVCKTCDRFNADQNTCVHPSCGCSMKFKPQLRAMTCPLDKWPKLEDPEPPSFAVVPMQGGERAFAGISAQHPSQYEVTAIIPVIEPDRCLIQVIELLRLQTLKPYILLIDTGSTPRTVAWLESLRAADVEIHFLKTHGVSHPSELVSMALDVGVALSRSRFNFFTHADCFLRKQSALAELRGLAEEYIVAGHQITERPYQGWDQEFGHTLLMVDQVEISARGIAWSMFHGSRLFGVANYGDPSLPANWVDTERGFNEGLKRARIPGRFTGREINFQRNVDDWIDHVRSLSGSKIYSPEYQAKALTWLPDAIREADERIKSWSAESAMSRGASTH